MDSSAGLGSLRQAAEGPEVDFIGDLSGQCGMAAPEVVEAEVPVQASAEFCRCCVRAQVDILVLHRPPQSLDQDNDPSSDLCRPC